MRTTGKATDLITFSRSSGGTALRKIAYGPELVTNGTFDTDASGWTAYNLASPLSIVASKIRVDDSGNGGVFSSAYQTVSVTPGKVYEVKYQAFPVSISGFFSVTSSASPVSAVGDLVWNASISASEQKSYAFTATSSTVTIQLGVNSVGICDFDNISVKEVLFDQGDLTLFNHPADIPRIEYDANGNVLGLLVEESRTNLVTYSEDFSNSYWPKADVTVSRSSVVDPTGGTNAYELVESATTANHLLNRTAVVGSGTYSEFIFAKANTRSWMRLQSQSPFNSWVNVNLLTGEKGLSGGGEDFSSVENVGNGWYKISLGFTATTFTGPQIFVLDSDRGGAGPVYTGDGTSGIYIYGAQLEQGAFPTSYIPTSGSTATRAADVASIATSEFGYRDDEGTLVVDYYAFAGQGTTTRIAALNDGSASNSIQVAVLDVGNTYHEVRSGGTVQAATVFSGVITDNALTKTAAASSKDDFAGTTNGGALGTDTSGAMPTGVTTLNIGSHYSGNFHCNGHIKSIKYIPRRLTNDQLQEITS